MFSLMFTYIETVSKPVERSSLKLRGLAIPFNAHIAFLTENSLNLLSPTQSMCLQRAIVLLFVNVYNEM